MSRISALPAVVFMAGFLCLSNASDAAPPSKSKAPVSRAAARTTFSAAPSADGRTPSAAEAQFMSLVNQERARRGLRPLAWEPSLCVAGRQHSEEMARLDYFDHNSPTAGLETPADRWEQVITRTPDEYVIAENLFFGSVADVRWGHDSLMESSAHRANMLNGDYSRIGVGVFVDRKGQMWVTQMFLS